jgi:hypothetical protein
MIQTQQRQNQEITVILFYNCFRNFVLQSSLFQLATLASYSFDAERCKLCVAECWVQFLNDAPYAFANYGHSYRAMLGFFLSVLFFCKVLHGKIKEYDLNPDFLHIPLEFNSSAKRLRMSVACLKPADMRRVGKRPWQYINGTLVPNAGCTYFLLRALVFSSIGISATVPED